MIGAYDAGGTLIWSWHVWAADYDPEAEGGAVDFNGYSMMTRNLGALAADNSSVENILASYGLYYQWGRKDPFIGPSSYNAANGASASMYNGGGSRVYLRTAASSAETGTVAYAVQHPLTFITGAPVRRTTGCGAHIPTICGPLRKRAPTIPVPMAGGWLRRPCSTV